MIQQPSNMTLNTKNLTANLKWDSGIAARINNALQQVQRTIDTDALAFTVKYSRERDGFLKSSATLNTIIGSGRIIQRAPYAKRVYYAGGTVNLTKNPSARRRWFDTIVSNHKDDILRHAQAVLNREIS